MKPELKIINANKWQNEKVVDHVENHLLKRVKEDTDYVTYLAVVYKKNGQVTLFSCGNTSLLQSIGATAILHYDMLKDLE